MTREEMVRNLLTELIDMIDNGSQRDLDRADEIGVSIIRLFEQQPCADATREDFSQSEASKIYKKLNKLQASKYCDRNICVSNEYNGIGCDECEATKSQEPKIIQEKQTESEKYQKAFDDGYENEYAQARFDYEQKPREGHWVRWYETIEKEHCTIHDPHCKCSECDKEYDPYIASLFNYCPNCGIKIVEQPQESEVDNEKEN